jgi:hypothetical protein
MGTKVTTSITMRLGMNICLEGFKKEYVTYQRKKKVFSTISNVVDMLVFLIIRH